jgi:hypothetical protein
MAHHQQPRDPRPAVVAARHVIPRANERAPYHPHQEAVGDGIVYEVERIRFHETWHDSHLLDAEQDQNILFDDTADQLHRRSARAR